MCAIEVRRLESGDVLEFDARVGERTGGTRHRVTVSKEDFTRLAAGRDPEAFVKAVFRFLLDREPKESILPRFDIAVVGRYFPEFERELPRYFDPGASGPQSGKAAT